MKIFQLFSVLFLISPCFLFAQDTSHEEYKQKVVEEQRGKIQYFFSLITQDSSVTVDQANNVLDVEAMWQIEYYDENLTEEESMAFYEGDADTLVSRTFQRIEEYSNILLPSGYELINRREFLENLIINLVSSKQAPIQGDLPLYVNRFEATYPGSKNWSVVIQFYGHPYDVISKIIVNDSMDVLQKICLTQ
ncbi:MAG: hypothetical protein ACQETE_11080 [Bacteroidota bacterium]